MTEPDTGTLALAHNVPAMSGVEPVADASGNLGSGCTNLAPANGPLGDGLWAGAIDDRTPAAMVLDLVCMTAAGPQNTSEAVRINPAADDLQVFDASGSALDAGPWRSEPPDDRLYWIAVNGGVVTSAEQMG